MQIIIPNPKLIECLAANTFQDVDSLTHTLWHGVQIVIATDFQNSVARRFSGEHLIVCNEFFRNFLGQFHEVGIDYLSHRIRLFNVVGTDGIDGVELQLHDHKADLIKLSSVYGTQVSTVVKTWQV